MSIRYTMYGITIVALAFVLTSCAATPVVTQTTLPPATLSPTTAATATFVPSPTVTPTASTIQTTDLPKVFQGALPDGAMARLGQGVATYIKTSPDTKYLGIGTSTGVLVFDAASQVALWQASTLHGVSIIAWSYDSTKIAACLYNGEIVAWEAQTGRELFESAAYGNYPIDLAWTQNGKYLVSSTRNGMAAVWEASSGKILHKLAYEDKSPDPQYYKNITDMFAALSPDGQTYATLYDYGVEIPRPSGAIVLWNVATGSLLRTLDASDYSVHSLAWSPDGKKLANGSDVAASIGIWDAATGKTLEHLYAGTTRFEVYWSPDSHKLIAASPVHNSFTLIAPYPDEGPAVLDVDSGRELFKIPLDRDGTDYYNGSYLLNWSTDSAQVSVHNGRGKVTTYDTTTGKILNQTENMMVSQASTPDRSGYYIVSRTSSQLIRLWNVTANAFTKTLLVGSDSVNSLSWSPDNHDLATTMGCYCLQDQIVVWDVDKGTATVALDNLAERQGMNVAWSPDGKTLAAGYDGYIHLFDTSNWKDTGSLPGGDPPVFTWSPDGKRIAVGGEAVWDIAEDRTVFSIKENFVNPDGDYVDPVYSSDGKVLVTASRKGELIVWNGDAGERLTTLTDKGPDIISMAINENGSQLVTVEYSYPTDTCGKVRIWDVKANRIRTTISQSSLPGSGCADRVALSPDGKTLAVAFTDSSSAIALFDMITGRLFRTLRGHASYIYSMDFSPDGRTLASGSDDGTIILWNAAP